MFGFGTEGYQRFPGSLFVLSHVACFGAGLYIRGEVDKALRAILARLGLGFLKEAPITQIKVPISAKKVISTPDSSWPTSYKTAGVVALILALLWGAKEYCDRAFPKKDRAQSIIVNNHMTISLLPNSHQKID